jgi:exonuclease VII small subunit
MKRFVIMLIIVSLAISTSPLAWAGYLQERHEQAVKQYRTAKLAFTRAVADYRAAKQSFLAARQRFRQFRQAKNKQELFDKAQTFLLKADEAALRYLNVLKRRVENAPGISNEDRSKIIAELNEDITWLETQRANIENANSLQELRKIAVTVRSYWSNIRAAAKRVIGRILNARIAHVITKAEVLADRIEAKIQNLEAEGKDVSELKEWLAKFKAKVATAKEKHETAKERFDSIKSLAEANKLFREGIKFIKQAHRNLKEANQTLVKIVKSLKNMD